MPTQITLREAVSAATSSLEPSPTARRDAELLLVSLMGLTRASYLAHPNRGLSPEQVSRYREFIERRMAHEPVQYITGIQEFYGLPFRVTPDVLIPRPETEHLVEAALARLPHDRPARIADVGTGSGAIAVALAHERPFAFVTALDLSLAALDIARFNANASGVDSRICFLESDLLSAVLDGRLPSDAHAKIERHFGLPEELRFDIIVSNPPYIPDADRFTLEAQVRDFEPATALFSGPTGLEIYRRLIPEAHAALLAGGWLLMEIGYGQQPALAELLTSPDGAWAEVEFLPDLQSIPRVAIARKR